MKKTNKFSIFLIVAVLVIFVSISSAHAINIKMARVINEVTVVVGNNADPNAEITWQGSPVTTAKSNGVFNFGFTEVPASCVGTLSDGTTTMRVKLENCTPFAVVPRTGQTILYEAGDDGDLQNGVEWPDPRFTDNLDGTVTDNLTGLVWLKNISCFENKTWRDALDASNNLGDGQCGLTDGSSPGDWYLPNVRELLSLIDCTNYRPALTSGHPFIGVENISFYWSSTTCVNRTDMAWFVSMTNGVTGKGYEINHMGMWPVRGSND